MATNYEVLSMLIPDGGYVQVGTEFEGIEFIDCKPITKKQYEDGFAKYDDWKAAKDAEAAKTKEEALAALAALGLTSEQLAALGIN